MSWPFWNARFHLDPAILIWLPRKPNASVGLYLLGRLKPGVTIEQVRDHVLLVTLDPARSGYKREQLSGPYRELLTRLESIPGVRSAAIGLYGLLGYMVARRTNEIGIRLAVVAAYVPARRAARVDPMEALRYE